MQSRKENWQFYPFQMIFAKHLEIFFLISSYFGSVLNLNIFKIKNLQDIGSVLNCPDITNVNFQFVQWSMVYGLRSELVTVSSVTILVLMLIC